VNESSPNANTTFGKTRDGLTQLRRHWPADAPKAAVLLVHGIGEHSGRYDHVGAHLAARGFDTLAFDNRGFGQSGGRRAFVKGFSQYKDDVEDLLTERRELGVPVALFGHSLGGLICTDYLVGGRPQPDLAILSAPALGAEVPAWQRMAAPIMGKISPKLFLPAKIGGELLSRDPQVGADYVNDPLVISGATAGFGRSFFRAMKRVNANLARISVPTYVLHGSEDGLVPTASSEPLGELDLVTRKVWEGLRHECMNEPEKEEVLTAVSDWISSRL
jgi:alpha-beta hydrolase superfamily lysophospholipase